MGPKPLPALLSASYGWPTRIEQMLGELGYSGSPRLRLPVNENRNTLMRHLSRYSPCSLDPPVVTEPTWLGQGEWRRRRRRGIRRKALMFLRSLFTDQNFGAELKCWICLEVPMAHVSNESIYQHAVSPWDKEEEKNATLRSLRCQPRRLRGRSQVRQLVP